MNNKNVLLFGGVVVGVVLGYLFFMIENRVDTTETVVVATSTDTTKDTVVEVGGTKKPAVVSGATNTYSKIGQKISINGVSITPKKVTYDSRCPKDVQCIQAGTVELGVLLESGSSNQNVIITLGKPFYFEGTMVTLTSVTPAKVSTKTISETEYRFLFTVKI